MNGGGKVDGAGGGRGEEVEELERVGGEARGGGGGRRERGRGE